MEPIKDAILYAALNMSGRVVYSHESRENVEMNAGYIKTPTRVVGLVAIAPPVAAGSVDMLQRYSPSTEHGEPCMDEDDGGYWIKHADAIAWGAQQREVGWVAGRINGARVFDKTESAVLAAAERLLRDTVIRAEKAEAHVTELEAQLAAAKPFDMKA